MKFTVMYPVFIITKEDDVALVKVKDEASMVHALAVFTDEEGAVDFRDEHYNGWSMGQIPDEAFLTRLLTTLQEKVFLVAFDPYRMGTRSATIPLNVLLEQMN
jgi:Protein of unknown function (DUF2750)